MIGLLSEMDLRPAPYFPDPHRTQMCFTVAAGVWFFRRKTVLSSRFFWIKSEFYFLQIYRKVDTRIHALAKKWELFCCFSRWQLGLLGQGDSRTVSGTKGAPQCALQRGLWG